MSPRDKTILNGQVRVILPAGLDDYEVDEKPIPQALKNHPKYNDYEWIGSFGLKDRSGNWAGGKVSPPYKVQVAKRVGKKQLVYWDGKDIKPLSGRDRRVNNRDYSEADLDLGDPPVGWG